MGTSRKWCFPDKTYDLLANMTVYTRLAQVQTNKTPVSKGEGSYWHLIAARRESVAFMM